MDDDAGNDKRAVAVPVTVLVCRSSQLPAGVVFGCGCFRREAHPPRSRFHPCLNANRVPN